MLVSGNLLAFCLQVQYDEGAFMHHGFQSAARVRIWPACVFLIVALFCGGVSFLPTSARAQDIQQLLDPLAPLVANAEAADPHAEKDYNVIFVSLTNTRADHLGVYGYSRNTTPNIDRFAGKSLVFKNAFTHASWTLPVVISLFTSQYPFTHKLMNREEEPILLESVPTFLDVLKTNGYTTAAFVGNRDYAQKYGHTSRAHFVFDPVNDSDMEDWHRYGVLQNTMPPAREWLRRNKDKKFFLLVQGYDTHCPFAVPKGNAQFDPDYRGKIDFTKCYWTFEPTRPIKRRSEAGQYQDVFLLKTKPTAGDNFEVMFYPEDVKHMVALYDGEIFNADQYVGGLLEDIAELGLDKKTIVVIYSDHGDMFGKHGRFMRGGPLRGTFYDDVLHIPLLIYHPAIKPKTVNEFVQVIDIAPTLLDMLGLKSPASFVGRSAMPAVTNGTAINQYVFAGSAFTPAQRNPFFSYPSVIVSARNQQWKFIAERVSPTTGPRDSAELYDLQRDPEELTNVAAAQPDVVKTMKSVLKKWLESIGSEKMLPTL